MVFSHVDHTRHTSEKDIVKAQKWLQNAGSKVKVNGKMSIGMTTAICSFQQKNGLLSTGELDRATWNLLKKENGFWKRLFKSKWK